MTTRPIRAIAIITVAAAFTACSGNKSTAPSTSAAAPTITASTSAPISTVAPTTAAPVTAPPTTSASTTLPPTTIVPTSAAPDADATAELIAIVETLTVRRRALYEAPDPALIDTVCAEGADCWDGMTAQMNDLASKGWHVEGTALPKVVALEVASMDGPTLADSTVVIVNVTMLSTDQVGRLVDGAGTELATLESDTPKGFNSRGMTTLVRAGPTDDPWRILSQSPLDPVPA